MKMRGRFAVDREKGKLFGVCAGIANHTGVDANIIRVGMALFAVLASFTFAVAVYAVLAFVGRQRATRPDFAAVGARDDLTERMRSHDLRMQAIETYVTSSNSRLAREIEDLR